MSSPGSATRTAVRGALALALTLRLVAACGDDGGTPTATTPSSSTTAPTSPTTSPTTTPTTAPPPTIAPPATTSSAPDDAAQAGAAFVAFFDGRSSVDKKVALLQNGEKYRSMLVDASADPRFQQLAATVRSVQPTDGASCTSRGVPAPCAIVTFDLTVAGFPMLVSHSSPAVKLEGAWKVAASAWCDVVAIGGDSCPT